MPQKSDKMRMKEAKVYALQTYPTRQEFMENKVQVAERFNLKSGDVGKIIGGAYGGRKALEMGKVFGGKKEDPSKKGSEDETSKVDLKGNLKGSDLPPGPTSTETTPEAKDDKGGGKNLKVDSGEETSDVSDQGSGANESKATTLLEVEGPQGEGGVYIEELRQEILKDGSALPVKITSNPKHLMMFDVIRNTEGWQGGFADFVDDCIDFFMKHNGCPCVPEGLRFQLVASGKVYIPREILQTLLAQQEKDK